MFVARIKEKAIINEFLNKKGAMLVYGLRRVGKTTLIKESIANNNKKYVYYECLKASKEINLEIFVSLLKEQLNILNVKFDSFSTLFSYLNKEYKDHVFIIDEYSSMKQYYLESKKSNNAHISELLDSEFQIIVDQFLTNINLIISGSSINIMESLTNHNAPLFGRFTSIINLKQFNYLEAKEMLLELSNKDLIAFYSIFGGSPYVLEKVDTNKCLKDNICELLLADEGQLRYHLKNNVVNELEHDPDLHDILDVIKNGSKKYNEIESQAHITTPGLLSKRLNKLLDLGIIEARYPIGREEDKKKKYYQIYDNLLKFYYAYIFRQENRISLLGASRYYDIYIEPSIKEFISRRFENIVRTYFSISIQKGKYLDIIDLGTYFTSNSELDCIYQTADEKYTVYEVKYYSFPMSKQEQLKEIKQIEEIKGIDINHIGFVSSSGFNEKLDNVNYLDLDDLFN